MSVTADSPNVSLDPDRYYRFLDRALQDLSGGVVASLCAIGDRLGLFAAMSSAVSVTATGLAARAGVDERYTRDWLRALAAAGYVDRDPDSGRFSLPPEHALILLDEGSPVCLAGMHQELAGLLTLLEPVVEAFRNGGGIGSDRYPDHVHAGAERLSATWLRHLLPELWIPSVPGLARTLERGAAVADVACGRGRLLIEMASTYPNGRYVGYERSGTALDHARDAAAAAGVEDRVCFEPRDSWMGIEESYDLVMLFDAFHHAGDPAGLLEGIRGILSPEGVLLLLEPRPADPVVPDRGPVPTLVHGLSVLFCVPVAIAAGADDPGMKGCSESRLRDQVMRAGFRAMRRIPAEAPFHTLYEVRP